MSRNALLKARKVFTWFPLENVLLFFLRGTDYRGVTTKLIPPPQFYGAGTTKRVVRDGIIFDLDRSCLMQWYVYWGLSDITRTKLYSLVEKDDVILDVGTNIGETLLNFGKLAGTGGYVYGFEPDAHNYRNVLTNIGLNDMKTLHVFNVGVSDKKETVKLYRVDEHNLGMNRILNEAEGENFSAFSTIETDTLDNIIAENKIGRVDLIKIDIEGYEMHALRGAEQLLKNQKPRLFIEVGYTRLINNGTSPTEMVKFLEGLGYTVYHADTDERIDAGYDFSPLGDGGIDVYALAEPT